jgi:hypothetical protein
MNRGKAFVLIFLLSSLFSIAAAQSKVTDSLEKRLPQTTSEERVNTLNQLTYEFITHDNAKVVRYSDEAIRISRQIGYTKGEAIAHTYRGVYEYLSGQFKQAHIQVFIAAWRYPLRQVIVQTRDIPYCS